MLVVLVVLGGLAMVVVAVGLYLLTGRKFYGRLFANAHFFELANAARTMKQAALEQPVTDDAATRRLPHDPRALMTRAGLAVIYTVRKHDELFIHHYSVSLPGHVTTRAVGGRFISAFGMLIGLPLDKTSFGVARSTVHHADAELSQAEHDQVAETAVPEISEANIDEFRRAVEHRTLATVWGQISLPPER
jgi:hypothetical protein